MTQAFNLAQLANNLNTSGQLDATDGLYGALPIANGGTGQTSAANAINALLPSQSGNSGKFLTTNGSAASWGTVSQKILQVQNYYSSTYGAYTSTGTIWDGWTITPTSSTSKIWIFANIAFGQCNLNGAMKILRNGSTFMPNLDNAYSGGASSYTGAFNTVDDDLGESQSYSIGTYPIIYCDSPATTSALTYSLYYYNASGGTVYWNRQNSDNGGRAFSYVTLMEIGA